MLPATVLPSPARRSLRDSHSTARAPSRARLIRMPGVSTRPTWLTSRRQRSIAQPIAGQSPAHANRRDRCESVDANAVVVVIATAPPICRIDTEIRQRSVSRAGLCRTGFFRRRLSAADFISALQDRHDGWQRAVDRQLSRPAVFISAAAPGCDGPSSARRFRLAQQAAHAIAGCTHRHAARRSLRRLRQRKLRAFRLEHR